MYSKIEFFYFFSFILIEESSADGKIHIQGNLLYSKYIGKYSKRWGKVSFAEVRPAAM